MLPSPSLLVVGRSLRTRVGANTNERLLAAERDEPATTSARPPPSGMDLSYITAKMPDLLPTYQTESAVWSARTFRSAWSTLHKAYASFLKTDPARAAELRAKDWKGLALYNSYAETLHLMSFLFPALRTAITQHPSFDYTQVEELFVHLGQDVEVRGSGGWVIQLPPPTTAELQYLMKHIGRFGADGRGCVANTAHRASVWRGRHGEALGVTLRVGRYVPGAARALLPLARRGSLLILSKAGMGKTTLLRDLAAGLAQDPLTPRVTVVDTSNEIGGDGPIPLPYLGRCRRIQVPRREDQSRVMIEVIQNHTPDYLIVDEIATEEEAEAAWSISQRGVHMIGTCHGEHLEGLLQNRALNLLVGGAAQAFLSNEERRLRNKTKKTVLERPYNSPFSFVVELHARNRAHLYVDVNKAVDLALDEQSAKLNAAIGAAVELSELLPSRVERLLLLQDEKTRKLKGASDSTEHDADLGEDKDDATALSSASQHTMDEEGYTFLADNDSGPQGNCSAVHSTFAAPNHASGRCTQRRAEKQRRPCKTDADLWRELKGFF
ncbi:conserved hypothetical protein [Leishmania braziliensis MHOM/BR/75/M2904]|uniref:AAA+ ATPase domain-containing protein n=2 Tax=Leishmania braziliensis TaxID=5660 RepID=A4HIE0_LEIBR|nr:conserved hypothetical protein [Leishmania braziliensis MHOM/BR/75/M2904]KAI5689788.1 hypothetical protein MNV84_05961 [Leishmania braziliensis]CAJ2477277.1 unnamed protein product [Leishmania braziliensis]CAM40352.1 conserved hypothetical protein [Leishmania braziliensis MHOM/BR/75/M2904]SYZ68024.1 hypothetical_protein [Leishmania braziliensis MHOM/BR/75/M2904]